MKVVDQENQQPAVPAGILAFLMTTPGWTFAGLSLAGAVTLAGFTYKLGKDAGDSAAAAYRSANEMRLPELTKQAVDATKSLRDATSQFSGLVQASDLLPNFPPVIN